MLYQIALYCTVQNHTVLNRTVHAVLDRTVHVVNTIRNGIRIEAYAINSIDGRSTALPRGSLRSYSQDYVIIMVTPRSGPTSIAPT